jgi:hypothetical protein
MKRSCLTIIVLVALCAGPQIWAVGSPLCECTPEMIREACSKNLGSIDAIRQKTTMLQERINKIINQHPSLKTDLECLQEFEKYSVGVSYLGDLQLDYVMNLFQEVETKLQGHELTKE